MVIKKNHHRLVGFSVGLLVWFIYLSFHSINGIEDLFVFSQSIIVGLLCITISDFIFFLKDAMLNNKMKIQSEI
jgi:hypothetical protein